MAQQVVIFNFQNADGTPLAGGRVTFRLQFDISSGVQVAAGRLVSATLDANGTGTALLWATDTSTPSGSIYFVTAYTSRGQISWQGELTVAADSANYLLQEDGISLFLLEDSTIDAILLET